MGPYRPLDCCFTATYLSVDKPMPIEQLIGSPRRDAVTSPEARAAAGVWR